MNLYKSCLWELFENSPQCLVLTYQPKIIHHWKGSPETIILETHSKQLTTFAAWKHGSRVTFDIV